MYPHLMSIYSGVQGRSLRHRRANGAVLGNPMHADSAWIVVSHQHMLPWNIDGDVNWPRRQWYRVAVRMQRSGQGIDAKGGQAMMVRPRAIAPRDVNVFSGRV